MEKKVIRSSGGQLWCVAKLKKYERINTGELKAVDSGVLTGLLQMSVDTRRKRECLIANMTNLLPLRSYCARKLSTKKLLAMLSDIVQIAVECQRNGLAVDNLCWDMDHVFMERGTDQIKMLYWPVIRLEHSDQEMIRFFRQFDLLMTRNQVHPIIEQQFRRYLYRQESGLKLVEFQEYIRSLQRLRMRQRQQKTPQERRSPAPVRSKAAWLEDRQCAHIYNLSEDSVVVGRDEKECGLVLLQYRQISRRHARISFGEGQYYVTDLGSSNGTSVNGRRIEAGETVALKDGAELSLGGFQLIFHTSSDMTRFINRR